jgi:hypothetical protein
MAKDKYPSLQTPKQARSPFEFGSELVKRYKQSVRILDAFEASLVDVDDPTQLDLSPRAHEIMVTYYDHNELTMSGKPKKKKALLSDILDHLATTGRQTYVVSPNTADQRKLYLDAFRTLTDRLEQLGKHYGHWKQAPVVAASAEADSLKRAIALRAEQKGRTYEEELNFFLKHYADETVRPEVRAQLISNMVQ